MKRGERALRRAAGCVLTVVLCSATAAACGLAGPNHAAERERYVNALFEGDNEVAFAGLCESAVERFGDPDGLGMSFEDQSNDLGLTGRWDPMRGSSVESVTSFERRSGDDILLSVPVVEVDGGVLLCPPDRRPLGRPSDS